jgi:hypothetical protein
MVFRATVKVSSSSSIQSSAISPPSSVACPTCIVVLKQTYHPNWKATIRKLTSPNLPISPSQSASTQQNKSPNLPISPSSSVPTINVFPSYVAMRLEEPGEYEVIFTYTPSGLKLFLLFGALACSLISLYFLYKNKKK